MTFKLCSESSLFLHYSFLHVNTYFLTTHIMYLEPPHLSRIIAKLQERKRRSGFNFLQNNIFLSFQNVQTFLGGPSSLVLKGYRGLSSCDVVESGTDNPPHIAPKLKMCEAITMPLHILPTLPSIWLVLMLLQL